jgi:LPLT family lysophospholipid transporter-like MFS transporter
MLMLNIDPVLSYAVVGIGAVVYSPAKYGILPELVSRPDELLKANAKIESYTILAILLGSIVGGYLSDRSIMLSLVVSLALYGLSIVFNTFIPKQKGNESITYKDAIKEFFSDTAGLFGIDQSRYSLLGTGSFWLSSAVLRMVIIAWVPLTLGITKNTHISLIIAATGVGLAIGAVITPYLVTLKTYPRTIYYGLAMAVCILAFTVIHTLPMTIFLLLLAGCLGGIYIVPMNTCLQQVGHDTIGAGKTIAVQNFFENTFMFIGVGAYTLASKGNLNINLSITATGVVMAAIISYMYFSVIRNKTV